MLNKFTYAMTVAGRRMPIGAEPIDGGAHFTLGPVAKARRVVA